MTDLWARVLEEPIGISIPVDKPEELERKLLEERIRLGQPELFGFYLVRKPDAVLIVRSKNLGKARNDGEYADLED